MRIRKRSRGRSRGHFYSAVVDHQEVSTHPEEDLLCWEYRIRYIGVDAARQAENVRVIIRLSAAGFGAFLYVNGNNFIHGEETTTVAWTNAEECYGARLRAQLLEAYRPEILANEEEGFAHLFEAMEKTFKKVEA